MESTTHTVKKGDSLWSISKSFLGDGALWKDIYALNVDKIRKEQLAHEVDTDRPEDLIYIGMILEIPNPQI